MLRSLPAVQILKWCFLLAILTALRAVGQEGVFTVQLDSAPPPPVPLVRHGDLWRYHKGTNAPQSDWKSATANLDATWAEGPGGFGFDDGDDATELTDMLNRYTTVYIRKTFTIDAPLADTNQTLRLVMDWDDGFVAWLDGGELARSTNVPGQPGTEPAFTAVTLAGQNHEASAGVNGNPPTTYDLGPAGNRLAPGTHVLAIMGLNAALNSSDFSLIADLSVGSPAGSDAVDGYFALVKADTVTLSGSNTLAGAARVVVNGQDAAFDAGAGTWARTHALAPGFNRLFIASLDAQGNILGSITKDIVSEITTTVVGGTLTSNTLWSAGQGIIRPNRDVVVPAGLTLSIGEGTVVLLSRTNGIRSLTGGAIDVAGTDARPVRFLPADGTNAWRDLAANGTNAQLTLRHADVVSGQIRVLNAGTALLEDSIIRDLPDTTRETIEAVNGAGLTLRRTYMARFAEADAQETPVLVEDSLLEQFLVDGLDIKGTNVPLVVRRSTLRFADPNNDNADALDFGPGAGTVENCLIHHFPDKGVSIGGAPGTRISHSLIYECGIGISAYSSAGCAFENTTISGCTNGILFRNNPAPAVGVGTNLIVWGNQTNLAILDTSVLELAHSDVEGSAPPGPGNISADPLFVDPANGDFRLAAGSPARGSGAGGADMGATFPVGGIPATPWHLAAHADGTNALRLWWAEDAENETGFAIERSVDATTWSPLEGTAANVTNYTDASAVQDQLYFYRVRATNALGASRVSNIASAVRRQPILIVGGRLTQDTTWSRATGTILVVSNLIVPTNVTLTLLPGTLVKLTNNTGIRAVAGGRIHIEGTAAENVVLMPTTTASVHRELSALGSGSELIVRYADISGMQTTVYSNAVGLIEDSYFHDYRITGTTLTQPLFLTHFAAPTIVRRCHFREYYETLFRNGVITIEDCLFEEISGDALDFDGAQAGTVLRRCTFRHGTRGNVDAVDVGNGELGGCRDVVIEDCLMYDFPFDKGVSIGDSGASTGTVVRNCLMFDCLSGVQVKDNCFATVYNCTIVNNAWGFTNYNKINPAAATGGGHTTNAHNNILWNNGITISMANGGTLSADHCLFGNTNWPGLGNLNVDPLFVDAAAGDFRLATNSPCLGAGRNGEDLGARFPVGAPMALSHPRIDSLVMSNDTAKLQFWADSEKTYTLERTDQLAGGAWTPVVHLPLAARPRVVEQTDAPGTRTAFYRLVTPRRP